MKEKIHILSISGNHNDHLALEDYINREKLDIEIIEAKDFVDASDLLSHSAIDVIITDFQIGHTPVFDYLEIIGEIPWIVLTGHGNENIAAQALKSGAADYLILDSAQSYLPLLEGSIQEAINNSNQRVRRTSDQNDALKQSQQLLKEETMQKVRVQKSLKESQEIYRRFFQASSDAVFISAVDGRWIDMNQSALEMFGYGKREEIWSDSKMSMYWDPQDPTRFTTIIDEKGSIQDYPVKFKKKDGSMIEALVSATSYEIGGEVIGYQGFIRDVTAELEARKIQEATLKQQEALDQLSLDLGVSLSPQDIYQCMTLQIRKLFELDVIFIFRIDPDREICQVDHTWKSNNYPGKPDFSRVRFDNLGSDHLDRVLDSQKPLSLTDLRQILPSTAPGSSQEGTIAVSNEDSKGNSPLPGSSLIAPLIVEGQVIAVVQLFHREMDTYQEGDTILLSRIANLVAIGLHNAYLYQESQALIKKLTSLQRIEELVLENLSLPTTLDMLVDQLVKELGVHAADILYYHPTLKTLKFITQTGFRQNILQHTDLEIGEGLAGASAESKELIQVLNLRESVINTPRELEFLVEDFVSYFSVPLLAKGRMVGVMELFHRETLAPDQAWMDLLEMVAGLAAIAIDHQNLYNNLDRSRAEINQSLDAIIEGWAEALELRGIESEGHWRRIDDLTMRLAQKLGLEGEDLIDIRRGALLHDIGKMGIPDEVLHKGTKLSVAERKLIGRHPVDAYELLKSVEGLKTALDIPLYHHERWDGEGYPYQLAGEDIPFAARIFAVVDVWDALLSDRPYRKAFSRDKALEHLRRESDKHFDPSILKVFLELMNEDFTSEEPNSEEVVQRSDVVGENQIS